MNLFDLLEESSGAMQTGRSWRRAGRRLPFPGARVRAGDGREGRVVAYVPATERAFVCFVPLEHAVPVHRDELEVIGGPCAHPRWVDGETVWPGETPSSTDRQRASRAVRFGGRVS